MEKADSIPGVKWKILIIFGRIQFMRCMPTVKLSDHVVRLAPVNKNRCYFLCIACSLAVKKH